MDKKEQSEKNNVVQVASMRKMGTKYRIFLIVFSLTMMALLRTGFVFFIIGMLPCIVAYYMDVTKNRHMFKSVFAANFSGIMPYVTRIISMNPSSVLLQEIMGDASTWVIIYGSAFLGWLLVKMCPIVAQLMVAAVHQTQIMRYELLQKKLESEWGEEVKQFSGDGLPTHGGSGKSVNKA